jgi:hypothetical protein
MQTPVADDPASLENTHFKSGINQNDREEAKHSEFNIRDEIIENDY